MVVFFVCGFVHAEFFRAAEKLPWSIHILIMKSSKFLCRFVHAELFSAVEKLPWPMQI